MFLRGGDPSSSSSAAQGAPPPPTTHPLVPSSQFSIFFYSATDPIRRFLSFSSSACQMTSTSSACVAILRFPPLPSVTRHTPQVRHSSAFKGFGTDSAGFWQVTSVGAASLRRTFTPHPCRCTPAFSSASMRWKSLLRRPTCELPRHQAHPHFAALTS
jgi:hypothetical protein